MNAILLSALALVVLSLASSNEEMPEYIFENFVKSSYCESLKKRSIYEREDLENNCAAKVQFFYDQVSSNSVFSVAMAQKPYETKLNNATPITIPKPAKE